jgi:hypothetical protein
VAFFIPREYQTMPEFDREEQKDIIKQAIKEWLDEKAAEFGYFALKTVAVAAFSGLIYLALIGQGWKK